MSEHDRHGNLVTPHAFQPTTGDWGDCRACGKPADDARHYGEGTRRVAVSPTMRSYISASSLPADPDDYGAAARPLLAKLAASALWIEVNDAEAALLRLFADDLLYFATEGDGTSNERRAARALLAALT
jgi:hypothetical protein